MTRPLCRVQRPLRQSGGESSAAGQHCRGRMPNAPKVAAASARQRNPADGPRDSLGSRGRVAPGSKDEVVCGAQAVPISPVDPAARAEACRQPSLDQSTPHRQNASTPLQGRGRPRLNAVYWRRPMAQPTAQVAFPHLAPRGALVNSCAEGSPGNRVASKSQP